MHHQRFKLTRRIEHDSFCVRQVPLQLLHCRQRAVAHRLPVVPQAPGAANGRPVMQVSAEVHQRADDLQWAQQLPEKLCTFFLVDRTA